VYWKGLSACFVSRKSLKFISKKSSPGLAQTGFFTLIDRGGYYIVGKKDTPNETVDRIRAAFDSLIAEGVRDKIIKKYFNGSD